MAPLDPTSGATPECALPLHQIAWARSPRLVPYEAAVRAMETRVAAIIAGRAPELVWLLEHPPLYTAGTSAQPRDLLNASAFPVYATGRGGQYTYHGPGQRVVYVMLDVRRRFGSDVRAFVAALEGWLIATLAHYGLKGEVRPGRVGVWIARDAGNDAVEEKIAAIGIRVRSGISFHGVSLNVDPDLTHFSGIVPCGISEFGVTSLAALGHPADIGQADSALRAAFEELIAPTVAAEPPEVSEHGDPDPHGP